MVRQRFGWFLGVALVAACCGGLRPAAMAEAADAAESTGAHDDGHGGGEAHGNTHPMSVDPDLAIFTAVIFLLMVLILGKFAWRPIIEALDERERGVAEQIAAAQRSNEEAQRLLAEHEQKVAGASEEVRAMLDKARSDAEAHKQAIVEEARTAAKSERERAVREIAAAKNEALRELADRSVGTAVDLAGQIVGRQLNREDHAQLIQDALKQFPSQN